MINIPWFVWKMGVALVVIAFALAISSCSSSVASISGGREVLLVPSVNAGWEGWCVIVDNGSEGGCPPGSSRFPIVAESWSSGGPPLGTSAYAVTTRNVFSVSFDGRKPIRTRAEAALPDGLRAVEIEIHGESLLEESNSLPRFIPFNGKGEMLPQSAKGERSLGVEVPTVKLADPAHPASGVCRIHSLGLAGLRVGGGSVITRVPSSTGIVGQGFLSCASTSYNLNGWSLLAGVLLDASHPGVEPPPLSAMRPLKGHPDIFEAPGPEGTGPGEELVARRIHGAWLVVSRAKLRQRLTLLEHLRATIHL
jgi:hypothetical protein